MKLYRNTASRQWVVVLPTHIVKASGLSNEDELEADVVNGSIVIRKNTGEVNRVALMNRDFLLTAFADKRMTVDMVEEISALGKKRAGVTNAADVIHTLLKPVELSTYRSQVEAVDRLQTSNRERQEKGLS